MTNPAKDVDQSMTAEPTPLTSDASVRLDDDLLPDSFHDLEGEGFDLEQRQGLRRVAGIRTDLEDVTEVEYRQLRLERVVLMGVYGYGDAVGAENSLKELQALAETAGCEVSRGSPSGARSRTPRPTSARQGQGAARRGPRVRRGHRHLRRRADPWPAAQPRGRRQGEGHRPHLADPRHLRPARHLP
jgi:hypothetical protein